MTTTLHVLSIGSVESTDFMRNALRSRTGFQLFTAACAWDLYAILASVKVDVAILHDTLSVVDLRSCSIYIRRHWPGARILLIHANAGILDDPMYDERMSPGSSGDALLSMVDLMTAYVEPGNAREGVRNE